MTCMRGKTAAVFVDEITAMKRNVGGNERWKISFADETNALAVTLVRRGLSAGRQEETRHGAWHVGAHVESVNAVSSMTSHLQTP